jgi:hypothetical protein
MRLGQALLLVVGAALAAALAGALAFPAVGTAAECGTHGLACKWVATWAASPMAATPARLTASDDFSSAGFNDQTIRDIVWTSVGGQAVRISLSNRFGRRPVTFGQVDIGLSAGGPLIILGTNHRVTFGHLRREDLGHHPARCRRGQRSGENDRPGADRSRGQPVHQRTDGAGDLSQEAFQRQVYAHVLAPPGAVDIPVYPEREDWVIPGQRAMPGSDAAYYAIVDDLSSRDQPISVLRRSYRDGGRRDEAFTQDLVWQRSSLLISAERGDLENEFIEITAEQADEIANRIRQSASIKPAQ